jgi:hypothetical protein
MLVLNMEHGTFSDPAQRSLTILPLETVEVHEDALKCAQVANLTRPTVVGKRHLPALLQVSR